MTRHRRILWITALLIAIPLLAVVAGWGFRDRIALAVIRDRLGDVFTVPAEVDGISISPLAGTISVSGFRLGRHHRDPSRPLVAVDRIDLDWSPSGLLDRRLDIRSVRIDGVTVLVDRLPDGRVTLAGLLRAETPASATAAAGPSLSADRVEVKGIGAILVDAHAATAPWTVVVDHAALTVEDLRLGSGHAPTARFRAVLSIRAGMPPGFADGDMLVVPGLSCTGELLGDRLRIGAAVALSPTATLIVREDGRTGLDAALHRALGIASALGATSAPVAAPPPPGPGLAVDVAHLRLLRGSARLHDPRLSPHPILVEDIQLGIDDLWFRPPPGADPGAARIRADARIHQPGPHPPALLAVRALSAPLGRGMPSASVSVAISGFAFDTVDLLVPTGTRSAVGAEGFDASAMAETAPGLLRIDGAVVGDRGVHLPFRISGTATAPEMAGSPVALAIASRMGGSLVNMGQDLLGGGIEIVGGGLGVVRGVGTGVMDAGADLGGGLFRIVKGAVTLDGAAIGAGARQATVGVAGSFGDGVADAGRSVAGAGAGTLDAATGDRERMPWRIGIPARHADAVLKADLVLRGATVAIGAP